MEGAQWANNSLLWVAEQVQKGVHAGELVEGHIAHGLLAHGTLQGTGHTLCYSHASDT